MKICVYAISKNEEKFVERFCEAAKDADEILIADTGSTDKTWAEINKAKGRYPGKIFSAEIGVKPWRFDVARNAALALVPADVDVCVSLDLDEVLQPGWREEIERVWEVGKTTRLRYMFDWGAGIAFLYEKIHQRWGYKWHHPCHEYPTPFGIEEVWAQTMKLLVIHKPDPTKSRAQYLPLLKMSVEEDPHCPRNAFYYARELSFHNQYAEAVRECDRYLALPRATWVNERCYAYRTKGRCFVAMGDLQQAEHAFMMSAIEAPNTREPWCELALMMYHQKRWTECFAFAKRALAITNREAVYTVDPVVWGAQPHDMAAIAAFNVGLLDESLQHAQDALRLDPSDPRLLSNVKLIEEGIRNVRPGWIGAASPRAA